MWYSPALFLVHMTLCWSLLTLEFGILLLGHIMPRRANFSALAHGVVVLTGSARSAMEGRRYLQPCKMSEILL